MPIQQGRIGGGVGGVRAHAAPSGGWTPRMSRGQKSMPLGGWSPRRSPNQGGRRFRSPPLNAVGRFITGVTRDSAGAPLGNCVVQLFRTLDDQFIEQLVSDGSGNFTFGASGGPYYIVAYKPGVPDVAGTTVNTLAGA